MPAQNIKEMITFWNYVINSVTITNATNNDNKYCGTLQQQAQ